MADETRPDVTAATDVQSTAPESDVPAGGDPDGAAADRDANGRSGVSVPSWLAAALVVVLGLAVGGAGFAIGRRDRARRLRYRPVRTHLRAGSGLPRWRPRRRPAPRLPGWRPWRHGRRPRRDERP